MWSDVLAFFVNPIWLSLITWCLSRIIKSMYSQSKSCVKLNNTLTDFFGNYVGVKQGDNLRTNLFKIFITRLCIALFVLPFSD
jgi:hypothetical protein